MSYKLVQTCGACPEQYDVFHESDLDNRIGFLRLRDGYFRAEYMDRIVCEAYPKGDGIFEWEEREFCINNAIKAIDEARASYQKMDWTIESI